MKITPQIRFLLAMAAMIAPGVSQEDKIKSHAEKLSRQYSEGYSGSMCYSGPSEFSGCYRSVSMWDTVVFKAHILKTTTYECNRREWEFYHEATAELQAMCVKPVYISKNGRVLVMERVEDTIRRWYSNRGLDHYDALVEFNDDLRRLIDEMNGTEDYEKSGKGMCRDNHAGNIGVTSDGELKWLDYAP